MSGFADLIPKAQPALYGGGVRASGSEGATWEWSWVAEDNDGNPIDLSTGYTAACTVYDALDNSTVLTLDVTLGNGLVTVGKSAAATAGKAASAGVGGRQCRWALKLTETSDSKSIYVWGHWNSNFVILDEDGA